MLLLKQLSQTSYSWKDSQLFNDITEHLCPLHCPHCPPMLPLRRLLLLLLLLHLHPLLLGVWITDTINAFLRSLALVLLFLTILILIVT